MIGYDELVSALASWRSRQGLAETGSDYLGPRQPFPEYRVSHPTESRTYTGEESADAALSESDFGDAAYDSDNAYDAGQAYSGETYDAGEARYETEEAGEVLYSEEESTEFGDSYDESYISDGDVIGEQDANPTVEADIAAYSADDSEILAEAPAEEYMSEDTHDSAVEDYVEDISEGEVYAEALSEATGADSTQEVEPGDYQGETQMSDPAAIYADQESLEAEGEYAEADLEDAIDNVAIDDDDSVSYDEEDVDRGE